MFSKTNLRIIIKITLCHIMKIPFRLYFFKVANIFLLLICYLCITHKLTKVKDKIASITNKAIDLWQYCAHRVWNDTRNKWWINVVKTLNITIKSFLNTDIQTQACAMTYRTVLAVIPAFAILFAIGRGFGFQNMLEDELFKMFPAQKTMINYSLSFVDTYLQQSSEGLFVGVGIVFLLWTIISLIWAVEDAFNLIWGVCEGRSLWRKITDYTAMLLILPVLMICGSGFSIFVSDTIRSLFDFPFITPLLSVMFELASFFFTCMFFTAVFILVPNTRVKFTNALLAGTLTGIAFMILQWLFISGQLYVSRYNAIYGSFSFLPLLFLWLQLVWVICLTGSLICYATQNITLFNFSEDISGISREYFEKVCIAVTTVIVLNFKKGGKPVTEEEIVNEYSIPPRLLSSIIRRLIDINMLSMVVIDKKQQKYGYQPAQDISYMTINSIRSALDNYGRKDFIPGFDENFKEIDEIVKRINKTISEGLADATLDQLRITTEQSRQETKNIN